VTYTVRLICFNTKKDIIHQANDFGQAEHFFWAIVNSMRTEVETWQLTLEVNKDPIEYKYHFSHL
jgi:hypothetical protein